MWQALKRFWHWLIGYSEERDYPHIPHRLIDCSGCSGTGKVTYGPEHEFVKAGMTEPGTFTCSYCNGSGKVAVEIRE